MQRLFLILVLFSVPTLTFAAKSRSKMYDTLYFQGMIGTSAMAEIEDTPDEVDDQESEGGTALTAALGYRWRYFSVEFIYANLGTPTVNHDDFYEEEHKLSFIGGGLHWAWWFFDLKLGWGNMMDTTSYKAGPKATTFSASPNKKSSNSPAGYFGIGFNFDLGTNTELVIDYTAFSFTKKDAQKFEVGSSEYDFEDPQFGIGTIGIGLRWFL